MYAYIRGKLEMKCEDFVVIDVSGVGYRIATALSTLSQLPVVGAEVKMLTHLIVREDAHILYGFITQEELNMFEILLTVSGVGPKVALAMLSAVTPTRFGLSVMSEDYKALTKAQGVGGKLAQKIVFELKDKMKRDRNNALTGISLPELNEEISGGGKFSEAVSALIILGYTPGEANKAVMAAYSEELEIEEIIKKSLKGLGKG